MPGRSVSVQPLWSAAPHSGQSIMLVIGRTDQEANQQHDNEDHQGICSDHWSLLFAVGLFSPVRARQ